MVRLLPVVWSAAQVAIEFRTAEPVRVDPDNRIRCVLIEVVATRQPDRVLAGEPSDVGVVVAESVVVQSALGIEVLALEAQVAFDGVGLFLPRFEGRVALAAEDTPRRGGGDGPAPGGVVGGPDEVAIDVGGFLRGAEMVGVEVDDFGFGFRWCD